ncbi:hypothetical protein SEA_LAZERLEMON_52 [Streptomyces phage LazerLemon]|nr:hypothetical protein SEA_LAZERLEMON_52 [Streptomyces phage LazerLemon]
MPKIQRLTPEARAVLNGDCAGPPAGPRYRRHVAEEVAQARREPRPVRPHVPADHMTFRNADGSLSHICICVCDRCWPPTAGKHPGPCPDWNDEDV